MSFDIVPKFYGKIVAGVKFYYKPEMHKKWIEKLEGKEFEEIISLRHENPSRDQHAYYRVIVRFLCRETEAFAGYSEDSLHELLMEMFNGRTILFEIPRTEKEPLKRVIKKVPSMADMSKKEVAEYITKLKIWLESEFQIFVPDAENVDVRKYKTRNAKPKPDTSG